MSDYAWIITADKLHESDPETFDSSVGVIGPHGATDEQIAELKAGKGAAFRMKDDDGEVYYHGRFIGDAESEDGFGPLWDFGTPDSGAVDIEYYQGHRWVSL